ncbi:hypothetical protein M0804_003931 [Polistes exclamans]|nr:hypothetical protein M0804_003931 [Polistes exclamans]
MTREVESTGLPTDRISRLPEQQSLTRQLAKNKRQRHGKGRNSEGSDGDGGGNGEADNEGTRRRPEIMKGCLSRIRSSLAEQLPWYPHSPSFAHSDKLARQRSFVVSRFKARVTFSARIRVGRALQHFIWTDLGSSPKEYKGQALSTPSRIVRLTNYKLGFNEKILKEYYFVTMSVLVNTPKFIDMKYKQNTATTMGETVIAYLRL